MNRSASHRLHRRRCRLTATKLLPCALALVGVFSAVSLSTVAESSATDNAALRDGLAHAALLRDRAVSGSRAMAIVTSLTTEVGPRLAGSAAEARAREWAATILADLDLQPIQTEGFEMSAWQRHSEQAAVIMPFPQPLAVTALGGSVSTPAGGLTGEVVLFDTLIRSALQDPVLRQGKARWPTCCDQLAPTATDFRIRDRFVTQSMPRKFLRSRYRIPTLIKLNGYWQTVVGWW